VSPRSPATASRLDLASGITRLSKSNNHVSTIPCPELEQSIAAALAPLDKLMGSRERAFALTRARHEIRAAIESALKAERRRVVQEMTSAELRAQVLELVASHEALLDFVDDLERQPMIAAELRRLRCRGEIRWLL
jgi:hypothetical protein